MKAGHHSQRDDCIFDRISLERKLESSVSNHFLSIMMNKTRFSTPYIKKILHGLLIGIVSIALYHHLSINSVDYPFDVRWCSPLRKHVVIFESLGGADKSHDGLRRDTKSLLGALEDEGWEAEVIKFHDFADLDNIERHILQTSDAFISRVDPGEWVSFNYTNYKSFLYGLMRKGILGFPRPSEMEVLGSKMILDQVKGMVIGLNDTIVYRNSSYLREFLPSNLLQGDRVLKRSGGALGSGIWHLSLLRPIASNILQTSIKAREAVNNMEHEYTLEEFIDFCSLKYLSEDGSYLVDQRYLPRISEGEIRIIWIGDHPIYVVHRIPSQDSEKAFSAALNSGARHTYYDPWDSAFTPHVKSIIPQLSKLKDTLGVSEWPLLWTSDFILDDDEGGDKLVLGEINSSCVGFSAYPQFAKILAKEVISRILKSKTNGSFYMQWICTILNHEPLHCA